MTHALRSVTGRVLIVGAGCVDYRSKIPLASSVVHTDLDRFSPFIDKLENVEKLSFSDGEFDCVVAFEVFEHVCNVEAAFTETYRVLSEGGVLLCSLPFLFRVHGDPYDYRRLTSSGLAKHLEGFSRASIEPFGNRVSVISDLITTSFKVFVLLRLVNFLYYFYKPKSSIDAPSGYFIRAEK